MGMKPYYSRSLFKITDSFDIVSLQLCFAFALKLLAIY